MDIRKEKRRLTYEHIYKSFLENRTDTLEKTCNLNGITYRTFQIYRKEFGPPSFAKNKKTDTSIPQTTNSSDFTVELIPSSSKHKSSSRRKKSRKRSVNKDDEIRNAIRAKVRDGLNFDTDDN